MFQHINLSLLSLLQKQHIVAVLEELTIDTDTSPSVSTTVVG